MPIVPGFWTTLGRSATVDWCEPNYVHSAYVAETWNTVSSVPIAVLGGVALSWALREPWRRTRRFVAAAAILIAVGLGSVAFHATLLRVGQALDELPMVFAGLTFLFVVLVRHTGPEPSPSQAQRRRRLQVALSMFGLAFTAAYLFFEQWFWFFVVAYAGLVSLLVVRTAAASFGSGGRRRRRLFWISAGSYVGGVLFLWVPEHLVLACDHPAQALQLHAWFHLTSAVGSYAWLVWAAYDRASLSQQAPISR